MCIPVTVINKTDTVKVFIQSSVCLIRALISKFIYSKHPTENITKQEEEEVHQQMFVMEYLVNLEMGKGNGTVVISCSCK